MVLPLNTPMVDSNQK